MDKHDLIKQLIDLSLDLGRTPTRPEFEKSLKGGKYQLEKLFGNYSVLIQAAGLDPNIKSKVTNKIFERDLEKHVEEYTPKKRLESYIYPSIASISDIHWPFENKKVVDKFIEYVGDEKPEYVFIDGDAWDMYSHGKFPRTHNLFTPKDEENMSRERNKIFWENIKKASPQSRCIQMLGNHDVRPLKRTLEVVPQMEHWINKIFTELFTFEGVELIRDPREEFIIDNRIAVFHGYRTKLGDHRDYTLMDCINGHTHRGGVVFRRIAGSILWELNCGLAGDPEAKGLTYTPQKISDWTPGFGIVNKRGPQFIHE